MDDIPMKRNRRSGGRSARKLKRAAPLPDNIEGTIILCPGVTGSQYDTYITTIIHLLLENNYQCAVLTERYCDYKYAEKFTNWADDIDIEIVHIEAKRHIRSNIKRAMEQAKADSDINGKIPVAITKDDRKPILCTMYLDDWIDFFNAYIEVCKKK